MSTDKQNNFASAIKFKADDGPAVVAQGYGALASAIEGTARNFNIPVLQDFALSQELASIPLGEEIPEDLVFAIASVFEYLMSMDDDPGAEIEAPD
ncbi:MAG: EscU/YscU/HrcU family type III secretion system export apparatus switch protein [Pseudohongiellaceae bacterium]|jgi:type III secretion system FlhB-like substrate exporter